MTTPTLPAPAMGSSASQVAGGSSADVILYHEEYSPPFLPVLAILPFLLPLFWRFEVTVSLNQVVLDIRRV